METILSLKKLNVIINEKKPVEKAQKRTQNKDRMENEKQRSGGAHTHTHTHTHIYTFIYIYRTNKHCSLQPKMKRSYCGSKLKIKMHTQERWKTRRSTQATT